MIIFATSGNITIAFVILRNIVITINISLYHHYRCYCCYDVAIAIINIAITLTIITTTDTTITTSDVANVTATIPLTIAFLGNNSHCTFI